MNTKSRILPIDGLRGVAVLLVVLLHFYIELPMSDWLFNLVGFGWSGVDLFFVISGFLITNILLNVKKSPNYFKTFYIRRIYRILPLYIVTVLLTILLVQGIYGSDVVRQRNLLPPWWAFMFFLTDVWNLVTGHVEYEGLSVLWSLAVEEKFYMLMPALIYYFKPRTVFYSMLSLLLFSVVFRYVGLAFYHLPFAFKHIRADGLFLGAILALAVNNDAMNRYMQKNSKWTVLVFLLCALSLAYPFNSMSRDLRLIAESTLFVRTGLLYSAVLFYVLYNKDSIVAKVCSSPLLRWVGTISYGVYLLHRTIYDVGYRVLSHLPFLSFMQGPVAYRLFITAVTLLIAAFSWYFFERHLVKIGHRYKY